MANDVNKTPTWQWVAGLAMSGLLFFSSIMLLETRTDIKEVRQATAAIGQRVTVIETGIPLQFEAIKAWRDEMKTSLQIIADLQKTTAATIIKGQKSATKVKDWNDIK